MSKTVWLAFVWTVCATLFGATLFESSVIMQQRALIRSMISNPACVVDK